MQTCADGVLYSATDLVNFLGCAHSTALDLGELGKIGAASQVVDEVQTHPTMKDGFEIIYQGALLESPWRGYFDFLTRVDDAR
jgi:hypothetical protein